MSNLHPLSSSQSAEIEPPQDQPSNKLRMSQKHEHYQGIAASAPESSGAVVGKIGIAWTGFFAGLQLSDWVLLATLVYTVLQICLTVYERIVKPILAARSASRTNPQEKEKQV